MTRKTITITQPGDPEWRGRDGPDPFKPRSHYCMMILFILGIFAIIGIGIYIGIEAKKKAEPVLTTTQPSPTTTTQPSTTTTQPPITSARTTRITRTTTAMTPGPSQSRSTIRDTTVPPPTTMQG